MAIFQYTKFRLLLSILVLSACGTITVGQSPSPLEAAWVKKDIDGVKTILGFWPFENQRLELLKTRLKDTWSLEEQDYGFGGKRLDLGKGNGYTKMFIEAFVFDGRVAYYELGIESYSNEWSRIRDEIVDVWRQTGNVPFEVTEHRVAYRKNIDSALSSYRDAVSARLGPMKSIDIPEDLRGYYDVLTSFMENSAVSDGGCGLPPSFPQGRVAIDKLVERQRYDLVENVLRGYNPGARIYASLALLKRKEEGNGLSRDTNQVIRTLINLKIPITTCAGCFVYHEPAEKVFRRANQ